MTSPNKQSESVAVNLALLGYGKMGQMLSGLAPQRGCRVGLVVDIDPNVKADGAEVIHEVNKEKFEGSNINACLDFTAPDAAVGNIERVAAVGCNIVVGTTGWHSELPRVRKIVEDAGVGMVYASNFSIGMQLFYRVAQYAAKQFSQFSTYDPYLAEQHHQFKKDAPSGTALVIRDKIGASYPGREISTVALRAGYFPGVHEVGFDSEADTVELRHTARSRQGFAEGALYAARWVVGKKGLFEFSEILPGKEAGHAGYS